jgi:hypothetical protein
MAPRSEKRTLPKRTIGDRRSAVFHITYELEAMTRASAAFRHSHRRFDLEAALVHSRNLIEFFWCPSGSRTIHPDGVYAAHYFPSLAEWKAARLDCPQFPNELYPALCAQLSHISVRRSQRDPTTDFSRDIARLVVDLTAVWERFLSTVITEWVVRFRRRRQHWQAVV